MKEAKFDAATRQFQFTLVGLTKTLPDKSKDILKNINLSFYPGAKIGVVGLNGSGKVGRCYACVVSMSYVLSSFVAYTAHVRQLPSLLLVFVPIKYAVHTPQNHGWRRKRV